jgi:hypothetical protein
MIASLDCSVLILIVSLPLMNSLSAPINSETMMVCYGIQIRILMFATKVILSDRSTFFGCLGVCSIRDLG